MKLNNEQEWTEAFSERLKMHMKTREMSNAQLAEEACIGINSVINYRMGKHLPNLYAAAKIANVLDVSLDDLVNFEHVDIFEAAGFNKQECEKLRRVSMVCNVEPDVLIRVVRTMDIL